MPKDTFNNLSQEKKKRIFEAAVREFSTRRFSEASINQIIKNAGIPKGSFYQYFTDKEDLYLYMWEQINNEKHEAAGGIEIDPEADIFEICVQGMKAAFEWAMLRPDYSRIGISMWNDNSEFMTGLRAVTIERARQQIDRDKERGFIKPDVDSALVVDIIVTLILNEGFFVGLDKESYIKKLSNVIKIIKEGVSMPQD
jgi:Transcriptional regulator